MNVIAANIKESDIRVVCDRCGVEVTQIIRQAWKEWGISNFATPVSYLVLKGVPSRIGTVLICLPTKWKKSSIFFLHCYQRHERPKRDT